MGLFTTVSDVEARLGKTIADDQVEMAETLIDDAENMIRLRLPGRQMTVDNVDVGTVKQVAGQAVTRVLRNPDGYRSESVLDSSYTIDTRAAAGFLTILEEEWDLLGVSRKRAFGTLAPRLDIPARGNYWPPGSEWL